MSDLPAENPSQLKKNIFGLQRPEMFDCLVTSYAWGRQLLVIKLKRQNSPEVHYLRFSGVEFFCGPMHWRGASFTQASDAECLDLMRLLGRASEFTEERHIQQIGMNLYQVDLEQIQIQIIAHGVRRYAG